MVKYTKVQGHIECSCVKYLNIHIQQKNAEKPRQFQNIEVLTIQPVLPWDSLLGGTYTCCDGTQHPVQPKHVATLNINTE